MQDFQIFKDFIFLNYLGIPYSKNQIVINCITCNTQLQEKIYDSTFYPNLLTMLSAFIVLAIVVGILTYLSNKRYVRFSNSNPSSGDLNPVPLTTASMVLGIGIGGFIDGIVFHQIFQWHAMLSNKIPPLTLETKSVNMFWDGIFHFFTLLVVISGVILLWKLINRPTINKSGKLLGGGLLAGWGLFNLVEGVINHHLLKLHNVIEFSSDHSFGNYAFLGSSIILLAVGYLMIKQANGNNIQKIKEV